MQLRVKNDRLLDGALAQLWPRRKITVGNVADIASKRMPIPGHAAG